jgi:CheY-like chemotaxis protein
LDVEAITAFRANQLQTTTGDGRPTAEKLRIGNMAENFSSIRDNSPMIRPCYLVIDRETSSAISTRKLVIETAKFNVITAYTSSEAIETLQRFPALDGVVTDAVMPGISLENLITALKAIRADIPVIVLCTPHHAPCKLADHTLESFNPRALLELLQSLQPEATIKIEKHNEDLEDRYFQP